MSIAPFRIRRGAFGAAVVCLTVASPSFGQPRTPIERRQQLEQELAAVAPDAVTAFHDAAAAYDRNDFAAVIRLLRDVLTKAPRFTPALRGLGGAMARSGQVE